MIVKFNDLNKLHAPIMCEIQENILDVIKKSDFINGEALQEFESNWARYTGKKYCVGVSSGFHALQLSGRALGVKYPIVPTNSFVASASAFEGCRLWLAEIEPVSHLIDLNMIPYRYLDIDTIVPVHLYGQSVDMHHIRNIANDYNYKIIEDACQAHGNKQIGLGDVSCWSFYPGKNLGCLGDGGAVTTNNNDYAYRIRELANYGSTIKYKHYRIGYNCRLDTIQAAVLNVKLPYLDDWNESRRQVAQQYHEELDGFEKIRLLPYDPNSVYHLFVIESQPNLRDSLREFLKTSGIETGIHYPIPIHKQEAYKQYNHERRIVAESKADKILSLPMHPNLESDEVKYVSDKIKEFYNGIDWVKGVKVNPN